MKIVSIRSASLILAGTLASACGEVSEEARNSQQLSSTRQALACEGDTTPPALSLEDQDIHYECTGFALGNTWAAPSVSANDACEGPVEVHGYNTGDDDGDGVPGSIDPDDFGPGPTTEAEGLYYVQYLAWDSRHNIDKATLSVFVRDTLKPTLSLNPDNDGGDPAYEQVECFLPRDGGEMDPNPYVNPGASASDQCYGDLNQEIVSLGEANKQVPGLYTLEYQVRDGAYNWADPVVRVVEVIDSQQPVTEARPPIKIWPGTGWMRRVELSECARATDRCEGDLDLSRFAVIDDITADGPLEPGDVVIHGNNTFEVRARLNPGGFRRTYTVNYSVADSSGNVTYSQCQLYVPVNPGDPAP